MSLRPSAPPWRGRWAIPAWSSLTASTTRELGGRGRATCRVPGEEGDGGRAVTLIGEHAPPSPRWCTIRPARGSRLVTSVTAATRLAVANVRLQAEITGRLHDMAASRRRLVEAADEERRRLGEQLGDGPEARLAEVAARLERLTADSGGDAEATLRGLIDEVATSRAQLRDLAHGIRPRTLTAGGLRRTERACAAVERPGRRRGPRPALRARSRARRLFRLLGVPGERRQARGGLTGGLAVVHSEDRLRILVDDDGVGGADAATATAPAASPTASRRSREGCASTAPAAVVPAWRRSCPRLGASLDDPRRPGLDYRFVVWAGARGGCRDGRDRRGRAERRPRRGSTLALTAEIAVGLLLVAAALAAARRRACACCWPGRGRIADRRVEQPRSRRGLHRRPRALCGVAPVARARRAALRRPFARPPGDRAPGHRLCERPADPRPRHSALLRPSHPGLLRLSRQPAAGQRSAGSRS